MTPPKNIWNIPIIKSRWHTFSKTVISANKILIENEIFYLTDWFLQYFSNFLLFFSNILFFTSKNYVSFIIVFGTIHSHKYEQERNWFLVHAWFSFIITSLTFVRCSFDGRILNSFSKSALNPWQIKQLAWKTTR